MAGSQMTFSEKLNILSVSTKCSAQQHLCPRQGLGQGLRLFFAQTK